MSNIIFEITGLKPGEHFAIKGHELVTPDYWIDEMGVVWTIGKNGPRETGSSILAAILTETYRIIRKPRLTGEQVELLKALKLIGFKYLYLSHYGLYIASVEKQTEMGGVGITTEIPTGSLMCDLFKNDKEVLDIIQILKDTEVEV